MSRKVIADPETEELQMWREQSYTQAFVKRRLQELEQTREDLRTACENSTDAEVRAANARYQEQKRFLEFMQRKAPDGDE